MAGQAQPFCQPYHPRAPMIFYIFKLQICRKNQILIHCWDLCVLPHIIFQLSSCSCLILSSMSLGPWQLGWEAHSCLPSHQEAGDGRQSGSAMSGIGINFCKDRHKDGQRAQTAKKRGRWSVWEDLGVDQGVWRRGGTHWLPVVKPPREGLSLESLDPGSRPLQSPKQRGGAFEQVSHSAWEGSSSKHRDAAAPHSHQAQRPPLTWPGSPYSPLTTLPRARTAPHSSLNMVGWSTAILAFTVGRTVGCTEALRALGGGRWHLWPTAAAPPSYGGCHRGWYGGTVVSAAQ